MSLRDVKVLALSSHNTWVFNSSRVISNKDSKHDLILPPPGFVRASREQEEPNFSFDRVADVNLMALVAILDAAHGFSPSVSGQEDSVARVSLDMDMALNPSVKKVPPSLNNFIAGESDVFVDYEAPNKIWEGSPQHCALKKVLVKKTQKCVCKQEKPILLVVGEDVPLKEIMLTNALTLVGWFGGRKISADGIHSWVADSWLPLVSLYPKIFILPRGWLDFKFQNVGDLDIILKGFWKWDNSGLFLKC